MQNEQTAKKIANYDMLPGPKPIDTSDSSDNQTSSNNCPLIGGETVCCVFDNEFRLFCPRNATSDNPTWQRHYSYLVHTKHVQIIMILMTST